MWSDLPGAITPNSTRGADDPGAAGRAELRDDPRVRPEHVRSVAVGGGRVVLVGAVHDHPASVYRAAAVVRDVAPEVVAVELPRLAVPLFERFAADGADDPGGEMSAAIGAAEDTRVVGVDAPSVAFLRALAGGIREATPGVEALRDLAAHTLGVTGHALRCRVAASSLPVPVERPVEAYEHDCEPSDPPAVQADHEAASLARSRSLLGALEAPVAARLVDEARERAMARRLAALAREGDVVAVVGFDHLDDVAAQLG